MADKIEDKKPVAKAAPVKAAASVPAKRAAIVPVKPAAVAKPAASPANPVVAAETVAKPVESPKPVEMPKPVQAEAPAEGKKIMNETFQKVEETAKNFASEATAKATDAFNDMNARAKSAMEKGSKALEDAVEFSKGNMEAMVASARVAAKGAQDIAKYSADYGRKAIEDANATARQFAAVKSPTEFFQLQSDIAKKNLDAVVAEASKFSESYLKLLGDIVQPIQNRYAVAVEKVKTAVAA